MDSHLEIEVRSRQVKEGAFLVEVAGEVDLYTGPRVRDCIEGLIDQGNKHLVVDLDKVRYLDSTGLGILMHALRRIQEVDGRIVLICNNARVLRTFKLTGFLQCFAVFENEPEAVASLP